MQHCPSWVSQSPTGVSQSTHTYDMYLLANRGNGCIDLEQSAKHIFPGWDAFIDIFKDVRQRDSAKITESTLSRIQIHNRIQLPLFHTLWGAGRPRIHWEPTPELVLWRMMTRRLMDTALAYLFIISLLDSPGSIKAPRVAGNLFWIRRRQGKPKKIAR